LAVSLFHKAPAPREKLYASKGCQITGHVARGSLCILQVPEDVELSLVRL
jgi:hypothetical protein